MSDPRLDAARRYTGEGWRVFVLGPTKAPLANCARCRRDHREPGAMEACQCLSCHGFYAASADPARVADMLRLHPDGMLAVRTGAASDLVAIDVDPPEGLATMAEMTAAGLLRETCAQRTGSGGWHLLYRHPGGYVPSGPGKAGHKVDVKGDGGYVVAAPSVHPRTGEAYRWRYDWPEAPRDVLHPGLLSHIQPPPPPPRDLSRREFDHQSHTRLRGLLDTVLDAPEGNRNAALHWAACAAGEMAARGEITEVAAYDALAAAGRHVGLVEAEIGRDAHHGTIGSGLRKGGR